MDPSELVIAHVDAEQGFSGGEVQVFLLMQGLRRRGIACELFAPPASQALERARELGICAHAVAMRNELDGPAVLALTRAFRQRRPSLVHLHTGRATWLGGWAARSAGVPAITTRRMDRPITRGLRTKLVFETLTRRAVAISAPIERELLAAGVPPAHVCRIASSVDPLAVVPTREREAVRAQWGATASDFVCLCLGALVMRKGHDLALRALRLAQERVATKVQLRLWIAGAGPEAAALESLARELQLQSSVQFLGARSDAADLLAACDALLMPSRREGLGIAALEAMAAARAVVATRVGGLGDAVVDGVTGLLVASEDPLGLAQAIERLALDPALCRRLGQAGPAHVAAHYSAEHMVEAYRKLYLEVLTQVRS